VEEKVMRMRIGYARVSTEQQVLARQLDQLQAYGCDVIYQEKMTGTKKDRPELAKVIVQARAGDQVVIESLSRLGRSAKDLLELIGQFEKSGVTVVSLKESIDTSTSVGRLLVTVLAALAQFERDLTVERTNEGLKAARARGRKGGRPPMDPKKIQKAIRLYRSEQLSVSDISDQCGISAATLYRYVKMNR
jgi:DNA invertase Pin-like site-specific DNA recombinase